MTDREHVANQVNMLNEHSRMTYSESRQEWANYLYKAKNEVFALAQSATTQEDRQVMLKQYGELLAIEAIIKEASMRG